MESKLYTAGPSWTRLPNTLLRWYRRTGRDLPWRHTRDPYAVLVSEVMLQQTQVSRVIESYRAFLDRFPTLGALAAAPLGDVLRAWAGLGYNRRARNLWLAARAAGPTLPATRAALDALPGIGRYTAGAVACFAFDAPEAFADTNIRRVLGRVAVGRPVAVDEAEAIDARLLPRRRAAAWHHALMDLGATICVARSPRCDACPIAGDCVAHRSGTAALLPEPKAQTAFATSDRRVRGQIVALLREHEAMSVKMLERRIGDERVPRLLDALCVDGLVVRRGRVVALPS